MSEAVSRILHVGFLFTLGLALVVGLAWKWPDFSKDVASGLSTRSSAVLPPEDRRPPEPRRSRSMKRLWLAMCTATLLLAQGNRQEAETLAIQVQTAPPVPFDPWWSYPIGAFLTFPKLLADLRGLVQ